MSIIGNVISNAVDGNLPSAAFSYWFIFCEENLLLFKNKSGAYEIPKGKNPPVVIAPWHRQHPIASMDGFECIAVSIDEPQEPEGYDYVPLRQSYDFLPYDFYVLAGKARELIYWDKNTQYCGVCGAPMRYHTSISKRCTCCGKEVWPSLALAIIVLISRGDEVLLVQSRKFKGDYYGLVSGFVETGESLEQCVGREVLEETSLRIGGLTYVGSQSWPFPSALMAAFRAQYVSGDLSLQYSELRKGGWFRWDHLPALPKEDSIARKMIDAWAQERRALCKDTSY